MSSLQSPGARFGIGALPDHIRQYQQRGSNIETRGIGRSQAMTMRLHPVVSLPLENTWKSSDQSLRVTTS